MTLDPKRKICIITGTRAEYGLLYWLMKEISDDPDLQMQLVVTAMHLSPEFGLTYKTIEEDGFAIDEKVEMNVSNDSTVSISKSIGRGVSGFADTFARLKPDIIVILGDRYEILAAATAAMMARIPIAHLHGGELSEGVIDESIRHAVTKMSHLHFAAAERYRKRIIQMGESPERVFAVGAPGLDHIYRQKLMQRNEFDQSVGLAHNKPFFLVTYHPVTLEQDAAGDHMKKLFQAFEAFPDHAFLLTKPNADIEGKIISDLIDTYAEQNPGRCIAHTSLGQLRYLSAIQYSDAVIGNSSSGLIEVPALKKPTINIGDRQRGRLLADSVISCSNESEDIVRAIRKGLSTDFQATLNSVINPYGVGGASNQIKETLKAFPLSQDILIKRFYVPSEV